MSEAKHERLAAGLCLLAALLILVGLERLEPRFFLRDDNATLYLPSYVYTAETVAAGELPLLDQHQLFGGTFLASGQTGVFFAALYPAAGLLKLLGGDLVWLVDLLAGLHLLLAALGMLVLLRRLGLAPALAVPLALCWAFLPFAVVVSRSWVVMAYLQAYLPWSHWLLLRCLARPSLPRWAGLAVFKAAYLLMGYLQYGFLAACFEALFLGLLWLPAWRERTTRRAVAGWAAAWLVALLLAAPLLIPTWNAKEASWERSRPLSPAVALDATLEPAAALAANLFRADGKVYFELSAAIYFVGPLGLAGLALALARLRSAARAEPAAIAALLTGLAALLLSTTLYRFLLGLPIFDVLRWPFKIFPIAVFYLLLPGATALGAGAAGRRRLALAAGGAWLNLALQLLVLLPSHWRSPIGPWTMAESVAALRSAPFLQPIGDQGRVATLGDQRDPPPAGQPLALGFDFATLAGKYHVHGHDPLKGKINVEIGYDIDHHGEMRLLPGGWPQLFPSLTARYLILRATSRLLPEVEATPGIRRLAAGQGLVLLENGAALPIVSRAEDGAALPFRWRTNGLELELPEGFPGGRLLVNVAGLPGYRYFVDGEDRGAPEIAFKRPLLAVPAGARQVELRYVDRGFQLGLLLCAGGLLLLLVGLRRGGAEPPRTVA